MYLPNVARAQVYQIDILRANKIRASFPQSYFLEQLPEPSALRNNPKVNQKLTKSWIKKYTSAKNNDRNRLKKNIYIY